MHDKRSPSLTDSVNDSLSDLVSIKVQTSENFKNLIIVRLNINSIGRNKLEIMADIIINFSLFHISESKLDSSFPNSQFKMCGYSTFRRD